MFFFLICVHWVIVACCVFPGIWPQVSLCCCWREREATHVVLTRIPRVLVGQSQIRVQDFSSYCISTAAFNYSSTQAGCRVTTVLLLDVGVVCNSKPSKTSQMRKILCSDVVKLCKAPVFQGNESTPTRSPHSQGWLAIGGKRSKAFKISSS